ncbi:MAG TPA: exonuclease domain-containing protein [Xanthobacteraceae bacterium]
MTLRICDLETTGESPPDHKVIEVGCVDLEKASGQLLAPKQYLCNPGRPIPPESRGVHHISDDMVKDAESFEKVFAKSIACYPTPEAFVAHNARFERAWIDPLIGGVPWICSYKVGLRLWPDAPNFKNQTLRYFLPIEIPERVIGQTFPPHRALPDAIVTAYIVREALKHTTLNDMIAWSEEPPLLPKIGFGKHRGEDWNVVPADYLRWIIEKSEMDDDVKWNAQRELDRRQREYDYQRTAEARAIYMKLAASAITLAGSVADLVSWFRNEAPKRADCWIVPGTPEYDELVAACAAKKAQLSLPQEQTDVPAPEAQVPAAV